MERWVKFVVSFFGTGFLPVCPGTHATAAAALIFLAVAFFANSFLLLSCLLGILLPLLAAFTVGKKSEEVFGEKDPAPFVLDEIAGFFLTVTPLVSLYSPTTLNVWATALGGFAFFRLFDIAKPWPVRAAEKIPGVMGIMLDDLVAGLFAAGSLFASLWIFNRFW